MARISTTRLVLIIIGLAVLAAVYVFQRFNFLGFILTLTGGRQATPNVVFIVNKSIRLLINDVACLLLIKGLFNEAKYLKVAYLVFFMEVCILLPLYLYLKLTFEGDSEISSPLLSQIHRLIVNPMLMALVIISFFYQRFKSQS